MNFLDSFQKKINANKDIPPDKKEKIRDIIQDEQERPLIIAIMGQTGVGKSSLLNALFGSDFKVGHVMPTTKRPERMESSIETESRKQRIVFIDLPGIAESPTADKQYLTWYLEALRECDIALWAFQAGTRAIGPDSQALGEIIALMDPEERGRILGRIRLVITKADLVHEDPWMLMVRGRELVAAPSDETKRLLAKQSGFVYQAMMDSHKALVVLRRPLPKEMKSVKSLPSEGPLKSIGFAIEHRGEIKEKEDLTALQAAYPEIAAVISELFNEQGATVCSARLNYNLNELLLRIVLYGSDTCGYRLNDVKGAPFTISPTLIPKLSNIILIDSEKGKVAQMDIELIR